MEQLINENMTAQEILEKYPQVIDVFMAYGLSCAGCMISGIEPIGEGARAHGMDEETIQMLLRDANEIAHESTKSG